MAAEGVAEMLAIDFMSLRQQQRSRTPALSPRLQEEAANGQRTLRSGHDGCWNDSGRDQEADHHGTTSTERLADG